MFVCFVFLYVYLGICARFSLALGDGPVDAANSQSVLVLIVVSVAVVVLLLLSSLLIVLPLWSHYRWLVSLGRSPLRFPSNDIVPVAHWYAFRGLRQIPESGAPLPKWDTSHITSKCAERAISHANFPTRSSAGHPSPRDSLSPRPPQKIR